MMKKILTFLLFVLIGVAALGCDFVSGNDTGLSDELYQTFMDFNLNTLEKVGTEENFLYSPLSLYYSLAILYAFSSDVAEEELNTLLGMTKEDILAQIQTLTNQLPKTDEYTDFFLANTVYYDNTESVYVSDIMEEYQSVYPYELDEVDFPSGEAGRRLAEKITEGTDGFLTLTESDFDYLRDFSFLINNTIYYRGSWALPFDNEVTQDGTFYALDGSEEIVQMMNKTTFSKYYESNQAKAAQIMFKDGSSMIFILPDENQSITELLSDSTEMMKIIQPSTYYESSHLIFSVPKFEFFSEFKLKETMKSLGLSSIFFPSRSNFSQIVDSEFFVENISQITKIQVDEEGVKVAASTTIYSSTTSVTIDYIEFNVNRPFLYVILSPDEIPMFFGGMSSIQD